MKKVILLALLCFTVNLHSQYYKSLSDQCKLNHKCKAEYHHDDFEDKDVIHTVTNVGEGRFHTCSVIFNKIMVSGELVAYAVILDSNGAMDFTGCTGNDNAYVTFLFKSGEKLTVKSVLGIECGVTRITCALSESDIKTLLQNDLDKLRMNFIEGPIDFTANDKQVLKLKEQLNCIYNIQTPAKTVAGN